MNKVQYTIFWIDKLVIWSRNLKCLVTMFFIILMHGKSLKIKIKLLKFIASNMISLMKGKIIKKKESHIKMKNQGMLLICLNIILVGKILDN